MARTGRPTKYDPAYCEQAIEFLGRGYSLTAFAGVIGVTAQTLHNWKDEHPQFFDAIKTGRAKGQRIWEDRLVTQAEKSAGNTAAIIFAMKNLYQDDWRDKQDHEHTGKDGGDLIPPTDNRQLARAIVAILGGAVSED